MNGWLLDQEKRRYNASHENHHIAGTMKQGIAFGDNNGDPLEKCYSGAVHDVLCCLGLPDQWLPRTIRSLDPARSSTRRIFTISCHANHMVDSHTALLEWTKWLTPHAHKGSVVICLSSHDRIMNIGELVERRLFMKALIDIFAMVNVEVPFASWKPGFPFVQAIRPRAMCSGAGYQIVSVNPA